MLSVRDRVARLLDEGSFSQDALLAGPGQGSPAAGAPVTGTGTIAGRPVAVMANHGCWDAKTVEKTIRTQEQALASRVPIVYLIGSTAAHGPDALHAVIGRRGAGRILHTQVKLSGAVPQVCVLSGPDTGGGAYLAALCDIAIMPDGDASTDLGSSHLLAAGDEEGIDLAQRYLSYLPSHWEWAAPVARPAAPGAERPLSEIVPDEEGAPFDAHELLESLLDAGSFLELRGRWAQELIVGLGRLNGRAIGVVANQPAVKAGMLSPDAADKAVRLVQTCAAFNLPLLFLVDTPGFAAASAAESQGSIRHAAGMISAVSQATVPKISVILRRAHGAALDAMAGPGMEPDVCLALPTASIADLGSELVVDAVVAADRLREELIRRLAVHAGKRRDWPAKRNAITPV